MELIAAWFIKEYQIRSNEPDSALGQSMRSSKFTCLKHGKIYISYVPSRYLDMHQDLQWPMSEVSARRSPPQRAQGQPSR